MATVNITIEENSNGDYTIVLSPESYDKLIDECKLVMDQAIKSARNSPDPHQLLFTACEKLLAIGVISLQPKAADIKKQLLANSSPTHADQNS